MNIYVQAISKSFETGDGGTFAALHNIDLTIADHSITVFKGPSGSGKTTLLSLIGAMARPTSGRIWIGDNEITGLPDHFLAKIRRQRFGFVFQNHHLVKGGSVLENVMLPAYPTQLPNRTLYAKARGLLEQMEIHSKSQQQVEKLSGGEQRRVAIARALMNDPDYLIADEPTAHLDTVSTEGFLEIVTQLKASGRTVLMASHDPLIFESEAIDQVVELRDGQILKRS